MDFGIVKLEQGKLGLTAGVHLRRCIAVHTRINSEQRP